jgi:formylglycine-generating enzyme required for sulfatase activity
MRRNQARAQLLAYANGAGVLAVVALLAVSGCGADAPAADPHAAHAAAHAVPAPETVADGAAQAVISHEPPPGPAPEGMVWVPGGTFWMGCTGCAMPDALPVHLVTVAGFWMDRTPVTNAQFERFVRATGYVTVAERPLNPADFPGVPADKLVPGSAVFTAPAHPVGLEDPMQWWKYVPGASWRHPDGPDSSIAGREDHPVVQIAWEDAQAYLKWAGRRLPTEAEYEYAARGGLDRQPYAWGSELRPDGKWVANVWQGTFPSSDAGSDGHTGTSPVTAFPTNGFGLYDMGGNVWQWCADWYRANYYRTFAGVSGPSRDPHGPQDSFDPDEPGVEKRVTRGGSFLCSDQYCSRYLVGSRGKAEVSSGSSNLGFRGVL